MSINHFGLDIGSTTIKVAKFKKSGSGLEAEAIGVGPAPERGIVSDSQSDLATLSQYVKEVISQANIRSEEVAVSLPDNQVYTKIIDMPALSERELSASLKYEMEQYIPLPLDQVRTDWQILGTSNKDGRQVTSVFLVAAPIALLNKYEKVIEQAGYAATIIETEMISVYRALYPLLHNPAPSIVLHMGAMTSSISVVKNGVILLIFTIDRGGLAITRAISSDLGIDPSQAESFKKVYGLNKETFEGKIGKSLFPILESIMGDVRKTMLMYKERYNNEEINQIVLSGGTALLPGIDVYFTNQLNVQVVLGNAFQLYNIAKIPEELIREAASFNTVVGLGIKELI